MSLSRSLERLLAEIRRETNGAVVGDMEARGIRYELSYGVGLPAIRKVARLWGKDHCLAKEAYRSGIRELMIAATVMADPAQVAVEEIDFWGSRITTVEIAENIAAGVICPSPVAFEAFMRWTEPGTDNFLVHTSLMTAARCVRDGKAGFASATGLLDRVTPLLPFSQPFLNRGLTTLIDKILEKLPDQRPSLEQWLGCVENTYPQTVQDIKDASIELG